MNMELVIRESLAAERDEAERERDEALTQLEEAKALLRRLVAWRLTDALTWDAEAFLWR